MFRLESEEFQTTIVSGSSTPEVRLHETAQTSYHRESACPKQPVLLFGFFVWFNKREIILSSPRKSDFILFRK